MWSKKRISVSYTPRSLKRPTTLLKRRICNADKASSNIKVVVRVRPSNDKDTAGRQVVQVVDDKFLVFDPKEYEEDFYVGGHKQLNRDMLKKRRKNMEFQFDRVFDQDSNNSDVFEGTTQNLISPLLDGYNCSVFVYGATGAGKTYTMLGSKETPGIAFLTMVELYNKMGEKSEEYKFDIKISYLEVYNETVKDLICPSGPLHLLDDGKEGVIISGIKTHHIDSAEELFQMLELGNRNRTQHPTDANAESSRSHAVFQVHLSITHKLSVETKISKLTMIDLAGSERGGATGGKGVRFSEGSNINKSLLALGNCVDALAEGHKHIPYRNSKLTRILKDSLGGNCKTVMIVNVAPSNIAYEETFNTLNYANRAKKISNKATKNHLNVDLSASKYKKIIEDLKQRICTLENENKSLREGETVSTESGKSAEECRDLAKGRQVLHCLYELEGKYNKELLMYQMKKKMLDWRIYQKHVISERFQLFEYMLGSTKNQSRMDESINNLKMQRKVYKDKVKSIQKLLKEKKSLREIALKEIESKGLLRELQKEIDYYAAKMKEECLETQVKYFKDLLLKQQNEMTSSDNIISRICKSMDYYYSVLKGYGKVTEQMSEQYLALVQQLAGVKGVSWEDEPCEFTILRKIMDLSFISEDSTSPSDHCTPSPKNLSLVLENVLPVENTKIKNYDSAAMSSYRVPSTPSLGLQKIAGYLSPEEHETEGVSPCKHKHLTIPIVSSLSELPVKLDFNKTFTVAESFNNEDDGADADFGKSTESSLETGDPAGVSTRKSAESSLKIGDAANANSGKSTKFSLKISDATDVDSGNSTKSSLKITDAIDVDSEKSAKSSLETVSEETMFSQSIEERPNPLNITYDSPLSTILHTTVGSAGSSSKDTPSLNTTFTKESPSPKVISTITEINVPILNMVEREKDIPQCNKVNKLSVQKFKPQLREVRSNLPQIRNGTSRSTSSGNGGSSSNLNHVSGSFGRLLNSASAKNRLQVQPMDKFKSNPGAKIKIHYNVLSEKNKVSCDIPKVMRQNPCFDSKRPVSSSSRTYQKENSVTASVKRNSPHCSPKVYTSKVKFIRPVMGPERSLEKKIIV